MSSKQCKHILFIGGAMDSSIGAMKDVEKRFGQISQGEYSSDYFYWTGKKAFPPTSGEYQIAQHCIDKVIFPNCIIGHSFGGDTAWKVCKLLEKKNICIDLLITLDAVSPAGHIMGFSKPRSVGKWCNVWTGDDSGWNNTIANIGGHWESQISADLNVKTSVDHVEAKSMLYDSLEVVAKIKALWK